MREMFLKSDTVRNFCQAQMRGTISPANPWDVMVDMFFYREPEDVKEEEGEEPYAIEAAPPAGGGYTSTMTAAAGGPIVL
jgi:small subunit ribosomal protein SAe